MNQIKERLLSLECLNYVRDQAGGEWPESVIEADAVALADFVKRMFAVLEEQQQA